MAAQVREGCLRPSNHLGPAFFGLSFRITHAPGHILWSGPHPRTARHAGQTCRCGYFHFSAHPSMTSTASSDMPDTPGKMPASARL